MNTKIIERDGNRYELVLSDNEGNHYEIGTFDAKDKANDVMRLTDMTVSVWCYGGGLDNHYITEYATDKALPYDEMMAYAKAVFDLLESDYYAEYGGTDSEGVEYNSIRKIR